MVLLILVLRAGVLFLLEVLLLNEIIVRLMKLSNRMVLKAVAMM